MRKTPNRFRLNVELMTLQSHPYLAVLVPFPNPRQIRAQLRKHHGAGDRLESRRQGLLMGKQCLLLWLFGVLLSCLLSHCKDAGWEASCWGLVSTRESSLHICSNQELTLSLLVPCGVPFLWRLLAPTMPGA